MCCKVNPLTIVGVIFSLVVLAVTHRPGNTESTKNAFPPIGLAQPSFASGDYIYPRIDGYGKVVRYPEGEYQPRVGDKIAVDLISSGEPESLNPGLGKVARFVNIYAGAGAEEVVDFEMVVVVHGGTTLAMLNDQAYEQRFGVASNPNNECMKKLVEAGVKFVVCGQSLASEDANPSQLSDQVSVAVSAMTANVTLQREGFSIIPVK